MNEDDQYWTFLEKCITDANDQCDKIEPGAVAAALMEASARFSAFYLASSSESRKDLKEDKDALIDDVAREFKKRFAENLEDYIENYKVYMKTE